MARIINSMFICPVPNQAYTDVRTTVEGENWEDIKQTAAEIAYSVGNNKLGDVLSGNKNNKEGKEKICTEDGCLYLDRTTHEYEDEQGNKFISGSTWASQFEKPFNLELIAPKTAEKKLTTVEDVLAGWEMKKNVSLSYGTTVHMAVECAIKYGELPNNPHLAALVQDFLDLTRDNEQVSEHFICDFEDHYCGIVDVLVNLGNKHVKIVDLKTGNVYKKVSLTPQAKELWPNLKNETLSIYQLQLSFYARILKKKGYKVDGLEIFAEAAEAWEVIKLPVLDIEEALCTR